MDIAKYENLDVVPEKHEYPRCDWEPNAGSAEKYTPALSITTQEDADIHLWMLVGHALRYARAKVVDKGGLVTVRLLTWREAFQREREALAWRAFARDVGAGPDNKPCEIGDNWGLYSLVDGERRERTVNRDHIAKLFNARLPERVTGKRGADILERVQIKRERAAKGKGETYFRKGHNPAQGGLFQ